MIDVTTKNKSFLEMSKYLRDHGIKNNKFMLELKDPTLQGVDPHSENLTPEQKIRIYAEVSNNIWYFLREVVRVSNGTPTGCPFKLILGTLAQIFIVLNNLNYILLLPRQVGKTIAEICYSLWATMFASYASQSLYFNKDATQSKANLGTYKKHRDLLPKWLCAMVTSKDDVDNTERVYYVKNKNEILVKGSAISPDEADKLGRGCTSPNIYADEFAFLKYNDIIYNAFYPAWKTASENAAKIGAPAGIHITTTPNNLDANTPGAFVYGTIMAGACRFVLKMYDVENLKEFVQQNSTNDFVLIEYGYKDCGKTDEWLEEVKRGMNIIANPEKKRIFDREYLLVWTESNDNSVFTEDQLISVKNYLKDPEFYLKVNQYSIQFYEMPDFTLNYIISSDTANGASHDNSVLLFIHPGDFRVVGLFKSNTIDTTSLKKLIITLMKVYFTSSILVMESNMSGVAIMQDLIRDPSIENRMYQEYRIKTVEKAINNRDGQRVETKVRRLEYGVNTNTKTRGLMFEELMNVIKESPHLIISHEFYMEIKTLIWNKEKIEAMPGMHDDIVMSYLITRYALSYEKCFRTKFGIMPMPSYGNIQSSPNGETNMYAAYIDMMNNMDNNFEDTFVDKGIAGEQESAEDPIDVDWIFKN